MAAKGPAEPVPASTVVVARDRAAGGIEVYLVQRHGRMGFMGGMHVFPGGKLSDEDRSADMLARVRGLGALAEAWPDALDEELAAGLAIAGVRETFEEAGLLLGEVSSGLAFDELRARLLADEPLAALLEEVGARLDLSTLTPLSRWITPELEPRRYDTRFYVARAPAGQEASHDEKESVAGLWLSPAGALERLAAGDIRLAPPTERTLQSLAEHASVEAAQAWARSRPVPSIEPVIRVEDDQLILLYPGDPEHPVAERALDGPTRHVLKRPPR